MKRYYYTDEDIKFLELYYPLNDWDKILERFPNHSKSQICSACSKRKIKSGYVRDNLGNNLNSKRWTQEEDEKLKSSYEVAPMEEVLKLLPGRSYNAIISRAARYNLISYEKQKQTYKDEETQYIINNWQKLSDYQIAKDLNRTFRSVKWMRESLGLYRYDPNRDLTYDTLERYLRGQIGSWKKESMEKCNFQCVLTGSKDFAIHHLYSFVYIVRQFTSEANIDINKKISDYSDDELYILTQNFIDFHNRFPLGVCVDKELHILFHHLYGKNINTPEQWNMFAEDYKKGKYNH